MNNKEPFLTAEHTPSSPKFPEIEVQLSGGDGNAFAVLGVVQKAMRRGGVEKSEIDGFFAEAQSGDYDHLLQTCMRTVNVL